MPKFFAVEVATIAIVQVSDDQEAWDAEDFALSEKYDIFRDCDPDCTTIEEIKTVQDLEKHGWNEQCIPYGGDGNTCLGDLLK